MCVYFMHQIKTENGEDIFASLTDLLAMQSTIYFRRLNAIDEKSTSYSHESTRTRNNKLQFMIVFSPFLGLLVTIGKSRD